MSRVFPVRPAVLAAVLGFVVGSAIAAETPSVRIERRGTPATHPSLAAALAAAQPGDTLVLAPGIHQGPVTLDKNRLTLRGEPGAVVTGSLPWTPEWRPEPAFGHAFSSPLPFAPKVMHRNSRFMINIDEKRAKEGLERIHREGVGRSGRNVLQSMFTYRHAEKRVVVSFDRPVDIAAARVEASAPGAAITLSADGVAVEDLIVFGGTRNIVFENADDAAVRRCLLIAADENVFFGKGANRCAVESCDLTLNMDAMTLNGKSGGDNPAWDVWVAHKSYGTYDKTGIFFSDSGVGNVAAGNYIYNVWNGIGSGNDVDAGHIVEYYRDKVFPQRNAANRGQRVHHNRIDLCLDDGLEPGMDLPDCQWYGNMITRALCGIRIKGVGVGPFYLFDNVMRACNDGMRFYKTTAPQAKAYIYHNYIEHRYAICYHSIDQVPWNNPELAKLLPVKGSPGYHAYNNVFVAPEMLKPLPEGFIPNHTADGNQYTCSRPAFLPAALDAHSRFDSRFEAVDPDHGNFAASPATAFPGIDLAKSKPPLPFCGPGYFKGPAPTAGLLRIEPERLPHGPTSGLWETGKELFDLGERDPKDFFLVPHRWVSAPELRYSVTATTPTAVLRFNRAPETRETVAFAVTVTDNDGAELAARKGSAGAPEEFELSVPAANGIRIRIKDGQDQGRWRVTAPRDPDARVTLELSSRVRIIKYDAGAYVWEYDNRQSDADHFVASAQSGFSGDFKATVVRPDGRELLLSPGGVVKTGTLKGLWKIRILFTKKAWLTGPSDGSTPLVLSSEQPTGTITPVPAPPY